MGVVFLIFRHLALDTVDLLSLWTRALGILMLRVSHPEFRVQHRLDMGTQDLFSVQFQNLCAV